MQFILILYVLSIPILKGSILQPYQPKTYFTKVGFLPVIQSIVLDLDENSDEEFKTQLVKYVNVVNSVILIKGNNTENKNMPEKYSTTDNPNIIIVSKEINTSMLKTIAVESVLKSHRSVLFIAITGDKLYECKNGILNTDDFQNVETFMNELWHKFRIAHVGVTFPLNCMRKIAVYSGKRNTNQTLYDRTIKLMDINDDEELQAIFGDKRALLTEDYPLRAGLFNRYPTTLSTCDKLHYYTHIDLNITGGYCGLDALMMYNTVKHFKFKVEHVKYDRCSGYGHYSTTNITGSLGCVIRHDLDISFNSRFLRRYSRDNVYFLHFVETDALCALVKQADLVPIWYYAINIYTSNMWLMILIVNVVIGLFLWTSSVIKNRINGKEKKTLYFNFQDAFTSMMFGITNVNNDARFIRTICLAASIMFLAIYQGHVNHVFTTLLRYDPIKKLEELYETNLMLYVTPSLREIMKQLQKHSALENKHQRNFIKRMTQIASTDYALSRLLQTPNAAFVARKKDTEIDILRNFTESDNKKPLINIVQECFNMYYLSYIGSSGFPFVEELQKFMERTREAGLAEAYYGWTCNMLRVPSEMPQIRTEPRHFASITLGHVRLAFAELIFFEIISIVVFIVELWTGRRYRERM